MKSRRVGLYNIKLTNFNDGKNNSKKKDEIVYNENLPFGMDEGCVTACNEENIRGVMRLFQFGGKYDKIEFKYIRDLLEIEK